MLGNLSNTFNVDLSAVPRKALEPKRLGSLGLGAAAFIASNVMLGMTPLGMGLKVAMAAFAAVCVANYIVGVLNPVTLSAGTRYSGVGTTEWKGNVVGQGDWAGSQGTAGTVDAYSGVGTTEWKGNVVGQGDWAGSQGTSGTIDAYSAGAPSGLDGMIMPSAGLKSGIVVPETAGALGGSNQTPGIANLVRGPPTIADTSGRASGQVDAPFYAAPGTYAGNEPWQPNIPNLFYGADIQQSLVGMGNLVDGGVNIRALDEVNFVGG